MSKKYIECEAFIEKCKKIIDEDWNKKASPISWSDAYIMFIDDIEEQPTADAQEVRHGKNITKINPVDEFECSECGFVCEICENIYDDEYTLDCQREYNPKFCPNCGAKMDKESYNG